jgi:hypothetical protein
MIYFVTVRCLKPRPGGSVGLECRPVTAEVVGSSPIRVAIYAEIAQW